MATTSIIYLLFKPQKKKKTQKVYIAISLVKGLVGPLNIQ